jgi:type IV pilus assembly protein PilC
MPTFSVEAMDNKGKRIKADIDASSANDAIAKLKQKGYKPMNVKEKAGSAAVATPPPTPVAAPAGGPSAPPKAAPPPMSVVPTGGKTGRKGLFFAGRVRHKQLTQFTQQLSVLMDAGLPIVRSLKILGNQQKPGLLKNIVLEVAEDVETGSSFSEALGKHPKTFDKLYVNMVKAGEAGGVLDVILQRLAAFMERMEALKRKIIGASIYPAVVITIAVGVVLAIMKFIVPKFREVFIQVHVEMPSLTVMLMKISEIIENFWYIILGAPFILYFILKAWGRTKGGRLAIDKFKLSAPLIGTIIKKSVIARFCRTLGTLLQSGVPILEALAIVKNATGNEVVSNAISTVHDSIREGESIAEPLAACGVFDDIVINMIDVGEETGELDKMLLKIADNYDAEVDAAVSALMSVMEPILIVGLGFTVGFIVVALFLPLISLLEGIGSNKRGRG